MFPGQYRLYRLGRIEFVIDICIQLLCKYIVFPSLSDFSSDSVSVLKKSYLAIFRPCIQLHHPRFDFKHATAIIFIESSLSLFLSTPPPPPPGPRPPFSIHKNNDDKTLHIYLDPFKQLYSPPRYINL